DERQMKTEEFIIHHFFSLLPDNNIRFAANLCYSGARGRKVEVDVDVFECHFCVSGKTFQPPCTVFKDCDRISRVDRAILVHADLVKKEYNCKVTICEVGNGKTPVFSDEANFCITKILEGPRIT